MDESGKGRNNYINEEEEMMVEEEKRVSGEEERILRERARKIWALL